VTAAARSIGGVTGWRATLAVLGAAAAFAGCWIAVEDVLGRSLGRRYDLLQIVWMRYAFHLAWLAALAIVLRPRPTWRSSRPIAQVMRSMTMLAMPLTFVAAMSVGERPMTVWTVFWIAPAIATGVAAAAMGEGAPRWAWVALALAFVATVLVLRPAPPAGATSLLVSIAMAASFGLYVALTRALRDQPVWTNLWHSAAWVFLALTLVMPWRAVLPGAADLVLFAAMGGVGLVALYLLDRLLAGRTVASLAPLLFLPVVPVGLARLTGADGAPLATAGGLLALIGVSVYAAARGSADAAGGAVAGGLVRR